MIQVVKAREEEMEAKTTYVWRDYPLNTGEHGQRRLSDRRETNTDQVL
jgi:hypothetical protein